MALLNFNANLHSQPKAEPARTWSKYQQDIFRFIETGTGNAIVKAVAGSGKTTTIVEAFNRVQGSSLFLAFNKSIAEELKSRGVNARTFHSLTCNVVTKHKNARQIETDKLRRLCNENLRGKDSELYAMFICKLVSLGRQMGIGCLVPDVTDAWRELVYHHDLELDHEDADLERALELASELLEWSNQSAALDFDDLLYVAVKDGLSLAKYDVVFVDEAQDTNAIQRALLRKVTHPGSRIIAVGDPAQAIYGFRGADSDSMNLLAQEFSCIELPLTVSYRCPQAVVKYAKNWVDHIEAAPNAPEGLVVSHETDWTLDDFKKGDLLVCRTTRPLISTAYQLLKARIPAKILGREIGQGIKSLVNKLNADTVDNLLVKLDRYTDREMEKARAKGQDAKMEIISDRSSTLKFLVGSLDENDRTFDALFNRIDSLFEGVDPIVTLSTVHKSKGLEADRVFWLNSSKCPAEWAKMDWQKQQEQNICYVATTRAKKELHLIEELKKPRT